MWITKCKYNSFRETAGGKNLRITSPNIITPYV